MGRGLRLSVAWDGHGLCVYNVGLALGNQGDGDPGVRLVQNKGVGLRLED